MLNGIGVLFVSIVMLLIVWAVVLIGSQHFGSTD